MIFVLSFQVGMDKALNQLSVPLGQLREEVMVRSLNKYTSGYNCFLLLSVYLFMLFVSESAFLCE